METDDPNGVADSKPIYFDLHSRTEIHYEVSSDAPLTELSYTGVGFNDFRIEVRDLKGAILTESGPYQGMKHVIRMPLPSLMHFEVVLKTNPMDWLLVEDLHFCSGPKNSLPVLSGRTFAQASTATPVPRYVAPVATPPPPVVVAPPPPPPPPVASGRPAAPTSPNESRSRTPTAGGQSGKDFAETQPEGGILVGLEVWKGEYYRALVIGGVRGIYQTDRGRVRGQIYGRGNGDPDITLQAENGDSAVVQVEATDDKEQVIALRARFANGQESPWVGREVPKNLPANKMPKNLRTSRLSAGGRGALGIYGGADGTLFRFGLIY